MLLWTINDFPKYRNLSGFIVKDYKTCPICDDETYCQYFKHSRKLCYMGHRKYLPHNYVHRNWKIFLKVQVGKKIWKNDF